MTLVSMLLASSVMAATPTTPAPWFEGDDYPIQAFERRWEGTTVFQLTVDPRGKPVGCTVEESSGHDMLDRRACSIAMKRARFMAALDVSGAPTYGVYRSRLTWALDPSLWTQSEVGPDFEVSLNKLPDGASAPLSVKYAVQVDASGAPVACSAATSGHPEVLNELGCAKIKQDYRKTVAGAAGTPIGAVQTAWITFSQ